MCLGEYSKNNKFGKPEKNTQTKEILYNVDKWENPVSDTDHEG